MTRCPTTGRPIERLRRPGDHADAVTHESASDQIHDKSIDAAYAEVLRAAAEIASPYLDGFQVKLIPTSDPLAQAALEINRRFPGRMATRFGGTSFGGMGVDGVYIYPSSVTATTP